MLIRQRWRTSMKIIISVEVLSLKEKRALRHFAKKGIGYEREVNKLSRAYSQLPPTWEQCCENIIFDLPELDDTC